jgi:type IV secretion system protein VirB2
MAIKPFINTANQRKRMLDRAVVLSMAAAILLPGMAFADATAETNLCSVLTTVNNLLNYGSVVIVTIAIIFSGYQIAFAHKRIGDVAPALIGGVMIGAAAQIAKMVIGGSGSGSQCSAQSLNTTMLMDHLHSAVQYVQHYA